MGMIGDPPDEPTGQEAQTFFRVGILARRRRA
jgi:hypothetical protein